MRGHDGAGVEKGYPHDIDDYSKYGTHLEQPYIEGATTVGAATGRGGDTHRGLKSRHIQFLYAHCTEYTRAFLTLAARLEERLELDYSSALEVFSRSSVQLRCLWRTSP